MTFTDNQKAIINNDRTIKYVKLVFPNNEISDIEADQIYLESLSLEESICDSDNIVFGKCNSSIFKIRVADFVEDIDGAEMDVYVTFTNAELGTVLNVPFGKYIVQSTERTSDRRWRDITATDYMTKFDTDISDWYNNVLYGEDWVVPYAYKNVGNEPPKSFYSNDEVSIMGLNEGDRYLDEQNGKLYVLLQMEEGGQYDPTTGTVIEGYMCSWNDLALSKDTFTERTVFEIRSLLCSYIGVTPKYETLINDSVVVGKTIEPTQLSARDLLQNCCEINGCFGHFNWEGELQWLTLALGGLYPSETLYPSDTLYPRVAGSFDDDEYIATYKSCNYADYDVAPIDSVAIVKEDGGIAVHYEPEENYINRYTITGNILLYGHTTEQLTTIAQKIYNKVALVTYKPNTTEMFGCVYMPLGQPYTVNATFINGTEVIGNAFSSFALKRQIKGIQAMFQTLEANGEQYQPETQANDVLTEFKILQGKSAKYQRDLEGLTSEFTDFAEDTTSKIEQHADEIVLSVDSHGNVVKVSLTGDRESGSTNFMVGADNISLAGKTINLTSDDIVITSKHFNVNKNGETEITGEYIYQVLRNDRTDVTSSYDLSKYIGSFTSSSVLPTASAELVGYFLVILSNNSTTKGLTRFCVASETGYKWYNSADDYAYIKESRFIVRAGYMGFEGGEININDKFKVDLLGNLNVNDILEILNTGQMKVNDYFIVNADGSLDIGNGAFTVDTSGNAVAESLIALDSISLKDSSYQQYSNATITSYWDTTLPMNPLNVLRLESNLIELLANAGFVTASDLYATSISSPNIARSGENVVTSRLNNVQSISVVSVPPSPAYIEVMSGTTAYGIYPDISDTKLKKNIEDTEKNALETIKQIRFIQFDWKDNDVHVDLGVSANQLETVIEDAVCDVQQPEDSEFDTLKNINTPKLVTYALKGVQELIEQNESQQQEINNLKEELATLKEQVAILLQGGQENE